jgi:hypothetical protein
MTPDFFALSALEINLARHKYTGSDFFDLSKGEYTEIPQNTQVQTGGCWGNGIDVRVDC